MTSTTLGTYFPKRNANVNPAKFEDEAFELYSIPAYDEGQPELLNGSEIGSTKKTVQPGDVLLSRIVPHIRRAWVVPESTGARQIASSEWIIIRGEGFDPNYVRHFLLSDVFHSQFMKTVAGVGGSLLRARPDGVAEISIPLPPIEEQRRIAAILDQADNLRRLRQRSIDRLDQLGQAIFYEMFGDPAANPSGFRLGTIRELMRDVRYGTSKKAHEEKRGMPILRMGNVTYEGQIDTTNLKYIELEEKEVPKWTVRKDDLVFNRTNSKDLVGKTAVYPLNEPMALAGYLVRARTNDDADPYYISGYLNSRHGKTILRNMCKNIVGMANINAQEFQDIPILVPPIEAQQRYREVVESVARHRQKLSSSASHKNELFASLQQRAFKGEL